MSAHPATTPSPTSAWASASSTTSSSPPATPSGPTASSAVLIVDWDVHHGNGTQDAFYADPDVLFISLHQDDLYPRGCGTVEQVGSGPGEGITVNIPLPAGSGDATYRAAFERIVLPIANQFKPELVLVSAGQDASLMDQLGRMGLMTDSYRWMASALIDIADRHAGGKIVVMQEGGYSELYGPYCTLAIVESLTGTLTGVKEPHQLDYVASMPYSRIVSQDAEAAMGRVLAQHAAYWPVFAGRSNWPLVGGRTALTPALRTATPLPSLGEGAGGEGRYGLRTHLRQRLGFLGASSVSQPMPGTSGGEMQPSRPMPGSTSIGLQVTRDS